MNAIWSTSTFTKPSRFLAAYGGHFYATVTDNGNIYTFASRKGVIYGVIRSKCIPINDATYGPIYQIQDSEIDRYLDKSPMRVISCPTITDPVQNFVINTVIPMANIPTL